MNRQQFNTWLRAKNACTSAVEWCDEHPELSVQELMSICPRGEWILWVYSKAGYAPEVLAPVAYRAATRAIGYAADALDRAGVQHGLHGLVITDAESALAAKEAARAAVQTAWAAEWAANEAARAAALAARVAEWAARAAEAAEAAEWAARAAARAAAADADWVAWAARAARAAWVEENKRCADDCRQMLPELRIEL